MGMENIEHVVVVMFENRSFDNLLGWLYDNDTDPPKLNIPTKVPPTFDGLKPNTYSNPLNGVEVFASHPPGSCTSCPNPKQAPTPDPNEPFDDVSQQLFETKTPAPDAIPTMRGFLENYATTGIDSDSVKQLMNGFGPNDAMVINDLARNFAVCDAWFASVPSQTWPNRGFVHAGSSDSFVNNDIIYPYAVPTIFNVLEEQQISWNIFFNSQYNALTYLQLAYIGGLRDKVIDYSHFKDLCKAAPDADPSLKLPTYSFIEPRFMPGVFGLDQPDDYHPPHNICRGEQFLAKVYKAVRISPYRDKILLVVMFDEHGGCYDHVPPPNGATPPEPGQTARECDFKFDRFGVRVPLIVISSYVEPGTVFRADDGKTPYDHTSILATLRDWLKLDAAPNKFLTSQRIAAAPTLDRVLVRTKGNENTNWPDITATCSLDGSDLSPDMPLNDIQRGLVAAAKMNQTDTHPAYVGMQAQQLQTLAQAAAYLHPDVTDAPEVTRPGQN